MEVRLGVGGRAAWVEAAVHGIRAWNLLRRLGRAALPSEWQGVPLARDGHGNAVQRYLLSRSTRLFKGLPSASTEP